MSFTIVWDVDDVLNDLMRAWFASVWLPAHPGVGIEYERLHVNPPHELLGMSAAAYHDSLDAFRLGDGYATLTPRPEVISWLRDHGHRCRHVALSATPLETAPLTASWVLRHFGRWMREFAFIPSPRPGQDLTTYDTDKGSWLRRLQGPRILVDDAPENLAVASATGCAVICWPQPWNNAAADVSDALGMLTRLVLEEGHS